MLSGLAHGFSVAISPVNLLFALLGAIIGTLIGVLPGLGPVGTFAILIPFVAALDPLAGLIMFAGVYYGAMYGGSTTSILVNVPGEASSVVTCLEGYQMARRGRAGAALAVAAVGSFLAGTIGILALTVVAGPLTRMALTFGPPEYFSLALAGLIFLSRISGGSIWKSLVMLAAGLALGTVGIDASSGMMRFTGNVRDLYEGIDFLPVIMGAFGIAEVMSLAGSEEGRVEVRRVTFRELWPSRDEWKRAFWPMVRGSLIGFLLGLVPGPSMVIASVLSYMVEKRLRKGRGFGEGAIEGVAGPEAANNGAVAGAYIPMLTLGLPFTPGMALVLAVFMIHGITPGPLLIRDHPALFWGVIASMYIGNLMLLVLNLPLVGIFARVATLPQQILMPIVLVACAIGVYCINYSTFDILLMALFGVVGYFARQLKFDVAPMVLALVLGPMMEQSFVQAMAMSYGNWAVFVRHPAAVVLLTGAFLALVGPALFRMLFRKRRSES